MSFASIFPCVKSAFELFFVLLNVNAPFAHDFVKFFNRLYHAVCFIITDFRQIHTQTDTKRCVPDAIEIGYRSIDTAQAYNNDNVY